MPRCAVPPQVQKQWGQSSMDGNLHNCQQKQTSSLLVKLIICCCCGKLTVTTNTKQYALRSELFFITYSFNPAMSRGQRKSDMREGAKGLRDKVGKWHSEGSLSTDCSLTRPTFHISRSCCSRQPGMSPQYPTLSWPWSPSSRLPD